MNKVRVSHKALILLMFSALLVSCASQKAAYVTASAEFNLILESYLDLYDKQDPATQKYWKEEVDPRFRAAIAALDTWGMSLKLGNDYASRDKSRFKKAKNDLLDILFIIYQGGGML